MSVFKDTKQFLDKMGLECLDQPGFHPHIGVRLDHLTEELDEIVDAVNARDLEELVDGLVDLIYVAAGTLNMLGVEPQTHWDEVHNANMAKRRGTTKRGSSYDAVKPEGWTPPNHSQYWGSIDKTQDTEE